VTKNGYNGRDFGIRHKIRANLATKNGESLAMEGRGVVGDGEQGFVGIGVREVVGR